MHDLRRAEWRTSTFSGGNGSCVEVASNLPGIIAVRDSKDRQGPALVFTPDEWTAFLAGVRADQFHL
jgi:hypothetical protein